MDTLNVNWPADRVERWPLSRLRAYAKNARIHSDEQIRQLAESIREFGFTIPLLVDEKGELIAGHGRAMAAETLGMTEAPVMVAIGWTEKQIKAYRIADNQLALNAGWDVKLLADELGELEDMQALIGFNEGELEAIFRAAPDVRPLPSPKEAKKTLADKFGVAPFSILNAREGWWQERKRAWLGLGIQSEIGRGGNLLEMSAKANEHAPGGNASKRRREASETLKKGRG